MKGWRKFKRGFKRGVRTTRNVAEKALKVATTIQKLINVEEKRRDIDATIYYPTSSGHTFSLNHLAQGTTAETRNGDSVKNKSISTRWVFEKNASATTTAIRCAVVLDTSPNSTMATWSDIYKEANVLSQVNIDNGSRFQILRDHFVVLDANNPIHFHEYYIPVDFHTKYDGSDSTNAGIMRNQILICMISTEATNTPAWEYTTRVKFIDN